MKKFNTLVLSGGGVRGFGMLGILDMYKDELIYIENYIGSSIGGMICLMLCLNYSPFSIFFSMLSLVPCKLTQHKTKILSEVEFLLKNIFNKCPTFSEFKLRTGKNLILTAFNIKNHCPVIYSNDLTPNVSILLAVEETMSIPYIFDSDTNIDGCITSPFPIKIAKDLNLNNILGIYTLSTCQQILSVRNPYDDIKIIIMQLLNMITKYEIMFSTENDKLIEFKCTLPFETFKFSIDLAYDLFNSGRDQCK